jgi:hypothetical protein
MKSAHSKIHERSVFVDFSLLHHLFPLPPPDRKDDSDLQRAVESQKAATEQLEATNRLLQTSLEEARVRNHEQQRQLELLLLQQQRQQQQQQQQQQRQQEEDEQLEFDRDGDPYDDEPESSTPTDTDTTTDTAAADDSPNMGPSDNHGVLPPVGELWRWWRVAAGVAVAAAVLQLVAWRNRALRLAALVAEKMALTAQAAELHRQVRIGSAALSRVLTERDSLAEKSSGLEAALSKAKQLADAARLEAAALVQERGTLLARVVRLEDDCQKMTMDAAAAAADPSSPSPSPSLRPVDVVTMPPTVSAPVSALRGMRTRDTSASTPGASDSSDAERRGIPRPRSRQQTKATASEPAAAAAAAATSSSSASASPAAPKGVLSTVKAPVSPYGHPSQSPRRWPASETAPASPPRPPRRHRLLRLRRRQQRRPSTATRRPRAATAPAPAAASRAAAAAARSGARRRR